MLIAAHVLASVVNRHADDSEQEALRQHYMVPFGIEKFTRPLLAL
ncbi:hypothetical protein [Rhizobium sp. AAP43]|nr:hypothetical protein [Rhizobium sp. AAP43]